MKIEIFSGFIYILGMNFHSFSKIEKLEDI